MPSVSNGTTERLEWFERLEPLERSNDSNDSNGLGRSYVEFFSRARMSGDRVGGTAGRGDGADAGPGGDPAADRSIETAAPGTAGPALQNERAARASGCRTTAAGGSGGSCAERHGATGRGRGRRSIRDAAC